MRRALMVVVLGGLAALASLARYNSPIKNGAPYMDEAVYCAVASAISDGQMPYLEVSTTRGLIHTSVAWRASRSEA